jgi:hypothetical protein
LTSVDPTGYSSKKNGETNNEIVVPPHIFKHPWKVGFLIFESFNINWEWLYKVSNVRP